MGQPKTSLEPMTMDELFALKEGDKFVVWWAKDDNPDNVRFDFELRTVESCKPSGKDNVIVTDSESDTWELDEVPAEDMEWNGYDTSRGYAYFFHPKLPRGSKEKGAPPEDRLGDLTAAVQAIKPSWVKVSVRGAKRSARDLAFIRLYNAARKVADAG